ncbi:MAG: hypothetical protein Tsb0010_08700 [Parvularculaceae bacterium]
MRRILILIFAGLCAGAAYAQGDERPVEARSLSGEPLLRYELAGEFAERHAALLEEAQAAYAANPQDAEALIWIGRRLGYLGRYGDAIAAFREGAAKFPDDARFLRHLGHRLISIRQFEEAEGAFTRAALMTSGRPNEIEPDGLPNERNQPTSTLKGNIWYHLGLVRYLRGDFDGAADAYEVAAALAANPDAMVAARYWLYLANARSGDMAAAELALSPVVSGLDVFENGAYYELGLAFKGGGDLDALLAEARAAGGGALATTGYGVAAKWLIDGRRADAVALMREIVGSGAWASFGAIAAEADLFRLSAD